jgi:hypothetical protein
MYYTAPDLGWLETQNEARKQVEGPQVSAAPKQAGGLEVVPDYAEAERIWKLLVDSALT